MRGQADRTQQQDLPAGDHVQVRLLREQLDQQAAAAVRRVTAEQRSRREGTQHEAGWRRFQGRTNLLDLGHDRRRDRRRQHAHLLRVGRLQPHEIERPVLAQRRELPQGLKADQLGQFFVRGRRHLQDPQFDLASGHGDQRLTASQIPLAAGGDQPRSEVETADLAAPPASASAGSAPAASGTVKACSTSTDFPVVRATTSRASRSIPFES